MGLTDEELCLVLAGLKLTIAHVEDDETRRQAMALASRLGGDPQAMFYGAARPHAHQ